MFGIQSDTSLIVAERSLVCQPKSGGVLGLKAAPKYDKFAPCN